MGQTFGNDELKPDVLGRAIAEVCKYCRRSIGRTCLESSHGITPIAGSCFCRLTVKLLFVWGRHWGIQVCRVLFWVKLLGSYNKQIPVWGQAIEVKFAGSRMH